MVDLNITASRIANARREKGFTQEELATRLGVTAKAVSKWERALSLPDIDLILALSDILSVPTDFLLGKSELQPANKTAYDIYPVNPMDCLSYDQIVIDIGIGLVGFITPEFLKRITELRVRIQAQTGVLIPSIRIKDEGVLAEREVSIKLFKVQKFNKNFEEKDNVQDGIIEALSSVVAAELHLFVNRHMVKIFVEHLRRYMPFCVEGVIPERLSLSRLRTILKALVKSGYSIMKLANIIEVIDEQIDTGADDAKILSEILSEKAALKFTLVV